MSQLKRKSVVKVGLVISLFLIVVIPVINMIGIECLGVKSSVVYATDKEIEFVDEEFKKSIILERNRHLPLGSEQVWEPLSQWDIINMEFVVIHEDFNPDSYEDIYMFPNVRMFASWDLDMTMQQLIEIDRYIKSIDLKGTARMACPEFLTRNEAKPVNFRNSLTEEILKELDGTESLNVARMASLLLEGIKLKDSHFKGESEEQMVNVINELINNDYVNLIDYSELDIDPSLIEQLERSDLVINNGIIRKKAKYEKETHISYIDLTDSTKWYYNGIMFLTRNKIMEGSIMGGNRYANPESEITNAEAITLIAKSLEKEGTITIADIRNDEKWYKRNYNALEVTTDEYNPSQLMNRNEFANLMKHLTEEKAKEIDMQVAYNNVEAKFKDWNQVPDEYKEGVAILLELKITNGTVNKDGEVIYNGKATLTRGMAATFIQRLIQEITE